MDAAAFAKRLAARARQTETALDRLLPKNGDPGAEDGLGRLAAAMRYVALGGGKRLRSYLALEAAALFGAPEEGAERAAAALECVHAYSLAHDDLPAMDDDDLRRGRPTAHIAFDEATAILAGDALQALAFEILADPATHDDPALRCALALELARASGAAGMVGGQMLDLEAEKQSAPAGGLGAVENLQRLKTGKLIRASVAMGALLGRAGSGAISSLEIFADHLGLAFQIQDDLLDVEGDERVAGKRLGKDAAAGKATFVGLLGADGARRAAGDRVAEAIAALGVFGDAAEPLAAAARFAIARRA